MLNTLLNQGSKSIATAENVMVNSSHPAVTRAMLDVLWDNGNAVDAAIVGSLLQPVHEPHQTNHAGTVVFLYWDAAPMVGLDHCRSFGAIRIVGCLVE